MTKLQQKNLTKVVGRFIDIIWYIALAAMIIWPIAVLVIGLSNISDPAKHSADINAFLHFDVSSQFSPYGAETTTGEAVQVIAGRGEVKINNTPSVKAWYMTAAITEFMGILGLLALAQIRKVFRSLEMDEPFVRENVEHMRLFGVYFTLWHLVNPCLQYLGGRAALNMINFHASGIELFPAFQFNLVGIFAGLAIIVLSGVMKEATELHQEQELTI
jgi:hypothetical protein